MHELSLWRAVFVAALFAAAHDAGALGFGRMRSAAILGQPLQVTVPLRVDDGEAITSDCLSAEVISGDNRLPASAVQVQLEGGGPERTVRVSTSMAIDEPIVTITLAAGCPPRLTQRLVALVDPPQLTAAAPVAPSLASAEAIAAAPQAAPAAAPRASAPAASPAPRRAAPPRRAPAPASAVAGSAPSSAGEALARGQRSAASASAGATPATPRPGPAGPRLRLEEPESASTAGRTETVAPGRPEGRVDAALAQAAAASVAAAQTRALAAEAAATSAQAAALAANQRLQALESELALLRKEAQANREAMNAMRGRAASDDLASRLMPWLLALLAVLAAMAVWLGLRLRKVVHERDTAWYRDAAPSTHVRDSLLDDPVEVPPASGTTEQAVFDVRRRPAALPVDVPDSGTVPGALHPVSAALPSAPAPLAAAPERRDVTVEEQIDLEQQADFFIVLGQDEAATDLLLAHLRGTGGGSPMPYLKLLQIYRRRGDHEAYERTRVRFNQRFNGVAPEWGTDLDAGRTLEDYPRVMARLQHAWWSPLDAMAELESMLFRKGEGAELFDLPAYEEVLFLYQLARDLLQHQREKQEVPDTEVDVLLPLVDTEDAHGLSVRHVDVETTQVLHARAEDGGPLPNLDLDLSLPPGPAAPTPPRAARSADAKEGELRLSSEFLSLDDPPPPSPSRR